ncbi:unnamed protein product [Caenorhabditis bovis]|uniref:MADF domain-containing protein n=1 Tax=Caenorhabditis bovis TaxID=2654633 RepID=A0A8S1FE20_9PELO|nr:unnamed protein product [Caenorhabditis bovis]
MTDAATMEDFLVSFYEHLKYVADFVELPTNLAQQQQIPTKIQQGEREILGLLDRFAGEQKRRMGRPAKIPPFSNYIEYKPADLEYFISLVEGDELLYDACDSNVYLNEHRSKRFDQIERKCSHFLAMRKGKNAQKLWQTLYLDFEKEYKRKCRENDNDYQFKYYKEMEFLAHHFENPVKRQILANLVIPTTQNEVKSDEQDDGQSASKRVKLETSEQGEASAEKDDWFLKVLETVTKSSENHETSPPPPSLAHKNSTTTTTSTTTADTIRYETPTTTTTPNLSQKHSDIISCVTGYLDNVPTDQLMLAKVRLFQFLESEKEKLKTDEPTSSQ